MYLHFLRLVRLKQYSAVCLLLRVSFAMPPKVDTDVKLDQLRRYVTSNVRQLASGGKTSLKEIFGVKRNSEEASFYKFLWSYQNTFTDVQRAHADATLALLTQYSANSGDAHPAVAPGVGAEHGAAGRCDSGVEQRLGSATHSAATEHARADFSFEDAVTEVLHRLKE